MALGADASWASVAQTSVGAGISNESRDNHRQRSDAETGSHVRGNDSESVARVRDALGIVCLWSGDVCALQGCEGSVYMEWHDPVTGCVLKKVHVRVCCACVCICARVHGVCVYALLVIYI
jgi:hypothetical protein